MRLEDGASPTPFRFSQLSELWVRAGGAGAGEVMHAVPEVPGVM